MVCGELIVAQSVDRAGAKATNLSAGSSRTAPVEKGIRLGRIHIRAIQTG
jgi:hypothetical protein